MNVEELQKLYETDFYQGGYGVWRDTYANAKRGTIDGFQRRWRGWTVQLIMTNTVNSSGRASWAWGIWKEDDQENAIMSSRLLSSVNLALRVAFLKWVEADKIADEDVRKQWWKNSIDAINEWKDKHAAWEGKTL